VRERILYLLYFKLTFARPVENAMTMLRATTVESGVAFERGAAGRRDTLLRIAIITQLTT
jgi:hypothetical protein